MFDESLTFEQIPKAIATILSDVKELKGICQTIQENATQSDCWLDTQGLIDYLPNHPSIQSVYRWIRLKQIPVYKCKETRALKFKKSEIDQWLITSRRMTQDEADAIHDAEIIARRNAKKGNRDE